MKNLLKPRGVAVIGASPNLSSAGGRALAGLANNGFTGLLYPVNPGRDAIGNLKCYPSITAVPDPVDLAIIYVRPRQCPAVRECGERGVQFAIVHADGFGGAGDQLYDELVTARNTSTINLLAPIPMAFESPT